MVTSSPIGEKLTTTRPASGLRAGLPEDRGFLTRSPGFLSSLNNAESASK